MTAMVLKHGAIQLLLFCLCFCLPRLACCEWKRYELGTENIEHTVEKPLVNGHENGITPHEGNDELTKLWIQIFNDPACAHIYGGLSKNATSNDKENEEFSNKQELKQKSIAEMLSQMVTGFLMTPVIMDAIDDPEWHQCMAKPGSYCDMGQDLDTDKEHPEVVTGCDWNKNKWEHLGSKVERGPWENGRSPLLSCRKPDDNQLPRTCLGVDISGNMQDMDVARSGANGMASGMMQSCGATLHYLKNFVTITAGALQNFCQGTMQYLRDIGILESSESKSASSSFLDLVGILQTMAYVIFLSITMAIICYLIYFAMLDENNGHTKKKEAVKQSEATDDTKSEAPDNTKIEDTVEKPSKTNNSPLKQGMAARRKMKRMGISSESGQVGLQRGGESSNVGSTRAGESGEVGSPRAGEPGEVGSPRAGESDKVGLQRAGEPDQVGSPRAGESGKIRSGQVGSPRAEKMSNVGSPRAWESGEEGSPSAGESGEDGSPRAGETGKPGSPRAGETRKIGSPSPRAGKSGNVGSPRVRYPNKIGSPRAGEVGSRRSWEYKHHNNNNNKTHKAGSQRFGGTGNINLEPLRTGEIHYVGLHSTWEIPAWETPSPEELEKLELPRSRETGILVTGSEVASPRIIFRRKHDRLREPMPTQIPVYKYVGGKLSRYSP